MTSSVQKAVTGVGVTAVALMLLSGCTMPTPPVDRDPGTTTQPSSSAPATTEPGTEPSTTESAPPASGDALTVSVQGYTWEVTPTGSITGSEAAALIQDTAPDGQEFYILEMDLNQTAGEQQPLIYAAQVSLVADDGELYGTDTAINYVAPNDFYFVEGSGTGAQALVLAPAGQSGDTWQIDTVDGQTFDVNL